MESPNGTPQNAVGTAVELLTGAAAASHSQTQASTLLLRSVINKPTKPFSLFLRNDGPENKGKCRGITYKSVLNQHFMPFLFRSFRSELVKLHTI